MAGTNLIDAQETVEALVADAARLPEPSGLALEEAMRQQGIQVPKSALQPKQLPRIQPEQQNRAAADCLCALVYAPVGSAADGAACKTWVTAPTICSPIDAERRDWAALQLCT